MVRSSVRALTEVWTGDTTPDAVLGSRDLEVVGPDRDAERLWAWLGTSAFAPSRSLRAAG